MKNKMVRVLLVLGLVGFGTNMAMYQEDEDFVMLPSSRQIAIDEMFATKHSAQLKEYQQYKRLYLNTLVKRLSSVREIQINDKIDALYTVSESLSGFMSDRPSWLEYSSASIQQSKNNELWKSLISGLENLIQEKSSIDLAEEVSNEMAIGDCRAQIRACLKQDIAEIQDYLRAAITNDDADLESVENAQVCISNCIENYNQLLPILIKGNIRF